MKEITLFECDICKKRYPTKLLAQECEARGITCKDSRFKVGSIVTIHKEFGWKDGSDSWVAKSKKNNRAHDRRFMFFYYVITAIDQDKDNPHRARYHLFTNAMTGKSGYRQGLNFIGTHYRMTLKKNVPLSVRRDSEKLIGKKASYLI